MGKFFLRLFLLFFIFIISTVFFLNYFGLETDKFDNLIKNKANEVNKNVKLEFNKTKIYLNIKDLNLILKLQYPKILLKENAIDLKNLDLILSLKSFYSSDFLLKKAKVSFEKNDIKDITKITNIFLPRILNKKLNKVFVKGSLEGEFTIPFNSKGNISKNYKFYGKIIEAQINLSKNYIFKNFTAELNFGDDVNTNTEELKIIINKCKFLDLDLSKSIINIKFKEKIKSISSSLVSRGAISYSQLKKLTSLFRSNSNLIEDFNINADVITNIKFNINDKFKATNISYNLEGDIKDLKLKIKEKEEVKNFLPLFSSEIKFKNTKVTLNAPKGLNGNKDIKIDGQSKFSKKFEKIKINYLYNAKNKEYSINGSSTLDKTLFKIPSLNYKKEEDKKANINFNTSFILNKYFLIESLSFIEGKNLMNLDNIKLNKSYELTNLNSIEIKTHKDEIKNNDFLIKKSDQVLIYGKVFDAEPILKSMSKKGKNKIFSKKFTKDIKVNFDKVISGTNDDVSDFAMIASIIKGSYNKLSLKGNFSSNEIIEMSIYQNENDEKTLQVISDRARPFVKHFDFIEGFEGGKLNYESNILKDSSTSNLVITNFKVSKVPALAQLLTLASLQGIADTLSGEGIRFESFEMKSSSEGNVMNIEDALAIGPAVSILLEGYVEKEKAVSLRGTLVPATKLNSIIASIPLVGDILVGKKTGEGVVGVSFKMKGTTKKIKTTVNPIKTLTPRFIVRAIESMKKNKKKTK